MRILFTADMQLEAAIELGVGEYGPGSRFQDQADVLDRIAHLAIESQVQLVAVLGDVFERAKPSPWAILTFQQFVRKLTNSGIGVHVILGNHDVKSAALPPALSIFNENGVTVSLAPSLYQVGDCVIAALPWTPPTHLISKTASSDRGELHDRAANALAQGAHLLGARCCEEFPDKTPILIGHWAVSGASLPTGLDTSHLREPVIALEQLASSGFRLAMFGHIHKAQVMSQGDADSATVAYCGSPCVMNWGEASIPHGVWVYETLPDGLDDLRFVKIDDRPFVTVDLDLSDGTVFSLPGADEVNAALVRVRYTCTEEQKREIDESAIRRALMSAGAVKVFFRPTVIRETRARVAEMTAEVSEIATFDLWLDSQSVEGDSAAELRAMHSLYLGKVRP